MRELRETFRDFAVAQGARGTPVRPGRDEPGPRVVREEHPDRGPTADARRAAYDRIPARGFFITRKLKVMNRRGCAMPSTTHEEPMSVATSESPLLLDHEIPVRRAPARDSPSTHEDHEFDGHVQLWEAFQPETPPNRRTLAQIDKPPTSQKPSIRHTPTLISATEEAIHERPVDEPPNHEVPVRRRQDCEEPVFENEPVLAFVDEPPAHEDLNSNLPCARNPPAARRRSRTFSANPTLESPLPPRNSDLETVHERSTQRNKALEPKFEETNWLAKQIAIVISEQERHDWKLNDCKGRNVSTNSDFSKAQTNRTQRIRHNARENEKAEFAADLREERLASDSHATSHRVQGISLFDPGIDEGPTLGTISTYLAPLVTLNNDAGCPYEVNVSTSPKVYSENAESRVIVPYDIFEDSKIVATHPTMSSTATLVEDQVSVTSNCILDQRNFAMGEFDRSIQGYDDTISMNHKLYESPTVVSVLHKTHERDDIDKRILGVLSLPRHADRDLCKELVMGQRSCLKPGSGTVFDGTAASHGHSIVNDDCVVPKGIKIHDFEQHVKRSITLSSSSEINGEQATEIDGMQDGKRCVTIRSLFSDRNHTGCRVGMCQQQQTVGLQEIPAGALTSGDILPFPPNCFIQPGLYVLRTTHGSMSSLGEYFWSLLVARPGGPPPPHLTPLNVTFEHEGNGSKTLAYYDQQVRSETSFPSSPATTQTPFSVEEETTQRRPYRGLVRSLQQWGCMHVPDLYCQGLTSRNDQFQYDPEFIELQYEVVSRAGNWEFSLLYPQHSCLLQHIQVNNFNENWHRWPRALQEGDYYESKGTQNKPEKELVWYVSCASEEGTEFIYPTIVKLHILYPLGLIWDLRWIKSPCGRAEVCLEERMVHMPLVMPTMEQFVTFRHVPFQILGCKEYTMRHLLQSASTLKKGYWFSQELQTENWHGRPEEEKLLRAQNQHEMAICLASFILQNSQLNEEPANVHCLAANRSSNSRTMLEQYSKPAATCSECHSFSKTCKKSIEKHNQSRFLLAPYADGLFSSYEERLSSNEWQDTGTQDIQDKRPFKFLYSVSRLKTTPKHHRHYKFEKSEYVWAIIDADPFLGDDHAELPPTNTGLYKELENIKPPVYRLKLLNQVRTADVFNVKPLFSCLGNIHGTKQDPNSRTNSCDPGGNDAAAYTLQEDILTHWEELAISNWNTKTFIRALRRMSNFRGVFRLTQRSE